MSTFECEGDFCPECGSILKLEANSVSVKCLMCGHASSLKNIIGVQSSYTIELTPASYYDYLKKNKKDQKKRRKDESAGQMDKDRECGKCGHQGMSYTTMQLRSADEGQTVFYFCPKCKNREVENS
ncbi:UNVERIFIED_CONTAM: hypothetical protein RMT77_002083 [Armadillidium vulgare]